MASLIPGPAPATGHQCPLDYPYLFTDELPAQKGPLAWKDPPAPEGSRFIAIDRPRHEEGRLWKCPECSTWWEYTRGEIPPTPRNRWPENGTVRLTTTYRPRWHRVSPWSLWDWPTRRRIRENGGTI